MTLDRDVVLDLLPGYFAGDLSAASRALVDGHLAADPEFAKMAERFGRLLRERPAAGARADDARLEAATMTRARRAEQRRSEFRGLAIGYGMAAVLLTVLGTSGVRSRQAYIIAATFFAVAVLCAAGWSLARRRPEWFASAKYWGD